MDTSITTGTLVVTGNSSLNGVTAGNINFTGNLYQNGSLYSPVSTKSIATYYQTYTITINPNGNYSPTAGTTVVFGGTLSLNSQGNTGISYSNGVFTNTSGNTIVVKVSYLLGIHLQY